MASGEVLPDFVIEALSAARTNPDPEVDGNAIQKTEELVRHVLEQDRQRALQEGEREWDQAAEAAVQMGGGLVRVPHNDPPLPPFRFGRAVFAGGGELVAAVMNTLRTFWKGPTTDNMMLDARDRRYRLIVTLTMIPEDQGDDGGEAPEEIDQL